ncbi:hypothetical protein ACFFX0_27245 [Citricoccus parietis]|uniref:Uncharacterized protein n=1 Tax=Citricoccus parietis TaxID=592307 RepID=A0ABV5G6Y2_9MICC
MAGGDRVVLLPGRSRPVHPAGRRTPHRSRRPCTRLRGPADHSDGDCQLPGMVRCRTGHHRDPGAAGAHGPGAAPPGPESTAHRCAAVRGG